MSSNLKLGIVFRILIGIVAVSYLSLTFLHQFYSGILYRYIPQPVLFFVQTAGLFTHAKTRNSDFRVEGWFCKERVFREIDEAPFFPIHAGNKENRFSRALYFFRRNRQVLYALEDYIVQSYNNKIATDGQIIGGVRFSSVREQIPSVRELPKRYQRKPLSEFSKKMKAVHFYTPTRMRKERCL